MLGRFGKQNRTALRYFSEGLILSPLTAISPLDGRYEKGVAPLRDYFSEHGLIKARVQVEVEWFRTIVERKLVGQENTLSAESQEYLGGLIKDFNVVDSGRVKEIERTTNHDVKAVEYFLKEKFSQGPSELDELKEFLHFACTSEDINNLAQGVMLRGANEAIIVPKIEQVYRLLRENGESLGQIPMIGRTHGQPATPTTIGKEFINFAFRIQRQLKFLSEFKPYGKFNGAVGNYNAHFVAFPQEDWLEISQSFVEKGLGLMWNPYTTQIEPHDRFAQYSNSLSLTNTILLDLCRDMWAYISLGYFQQKAIKGEVGSSTMPHKVNPIYFENAEGNLGVSNALLNHFAAKLPISRFQRDLSDSTVQRNIGSALGLALLSYNSLTTAFERIKPNEERMIEELSSHYQLLAEPVQTVMRKYKLESPYEALKEFTRGKKVTRASYLTFVEKLQGLPESEKRALMELTPQSYLGISQILAKGLDMFKS